MPDDPSSPLLNRTMARAAPDECDLLETIRSERLPAAFARGTEAGRYLLLDQIGEGAMGAIYAAYDPELDRRVAIKLLKPESGTGSVSESSRSRLQREAQAAARLSHPNVVSVYDVGLVGDQVFIAMELVTGQTLRAWLEAQPRSPKEILAAFLAAGEGLAAAHAAGLVHRDFKPENVLVGADGRVRVSDFGLARIQARAPVRPDEAGPALAMEATVAGTLVGTPAYMAPEQLEARETDARSDQFSFCVALWEALAGERPFAGDDIGSLRQSVLAGAVRAPSSEARLRPWIRRVLARGLSVRPEDRFASMEELLAELRRDRRRRILRSVRAVSLVALAAAFVGLVGWAIHRERTRCERQAEERAAQSWSSARRDALRAEGSALTEAAGLLDAWFADWRSAWAQTCRSPGERLATARALGCLERALQRTHATVSLFERSRGEASRATIALPLLDSLYSPDDCLALLPLVATGDSPFAAELEEARALALSDRGHGALDKVRQLLERARAAGDLSAQAAAHHIIALALWESGPDVADHLRQALRLADASGQDELALEARIDLADYLNEYLNQIEEAERVAEDAAAWLQRLGHPFRLELRWLFCRANLHSRRGENERALAAFRRYLELSQAHETLGSPRIAFAYNNIASQLSIMGRYAEGAEALERGLDEMKKVRWRVETGAMLLVGNLGLVRLLQERYGEALEHVEAATPYAAPLGENGLPYLAWLELLRGSALAGVGRKVEARKCLLFALDHADLLDVASLADAHSGLARLDLEEGRLETALEHAERAVEFTETRPSERVSLANSLFTLARVLRASNNDPDRPERLARRALEVLEGVEEDPLPGHIRAWLAEAPGAQERSAGRVGAGSGDGAKVGERAQ